MMMDTTLQPVPQTEMDALLLGRTKELTEVIEGDERNWKGIGISFLVITFLSFIIFSTVLFFSPELKYLVESEEHKELITLEEIVNLSFYPKTFNGSFLLDNVLTYKDELDNLIIATINNNTLTSKIWVNSIHFKEWNVQKYYISNDRQYILFAYDQKQIYRHSTTSKFRIYSIEKEFSFPLEIDKNSNEIKNNDLEFNFAIWSSKGNGILFAYNNNLYYKTDVLSPAQQVTFSKTNLIKYGIPDWLYEEEIFGKDQAVWFSPLGSAFSYIEFNDEKVNNISFSYYGSFKNIPPQYPENIEIPYSKSGSSNPVATVYINRLDKNGVLSSKVKLNSFTDLPDQNYLISFTWIDEENALVQWSNRVQNESYLCVCTDVGTKKNGCKVDYKITPDQVDSGWNDLNNEPLVDSNRSVYYIKLPYFQSDQFGSFKHLAQIKFGDDKNTNKVKFLTSGLYEVVELITLDISRNEIYYVTTEPFKPANRQIVKQNINTGEIICLSCKLDYDCLDYSSMISQDKNYWISSCNGPSVPHSELRSLPDNEKIILLENNFEIIKTLSKKVLPKISTFMVPIGNYNASVKMILPPTLKANDIMKYPMLINVYGGPGSQVVKNNFVINWGYYLATNKNIIFTLIDGRGSGYQGDRMLFEIYRKFGTVEIDDQLTITSKLISMFSFIDPKRIAIFGWSYGGYASSMALAKDEKNILKCGISVAPTTNWLYYDSAYTERYMGFPTEKDNLNGYETANLLNRVHNIKSNKLLLIHGSSDDNVHLQHSMQYIRKLNQYNIMYQLQIYPDQNHGLVNVGNHLYSTMGKFVEDCFGLNIIPGKSFKKKF